MHKLFLDLQNSNSALLSVLSFKQCKDFLIENVNKIPLLVVHPKLLLWLEDIIKNTPKR